MIPVDLSANCDGWIYDPNGSGIQILGIRSRDPFSGSTDISAAERLLSWKSDLTLCSIPRTPTRTSALVWTIRSGRVLCSPESPQYECTHRS